MQAIAIELLQLELTVIAILILKLCSLGIIYDCATYLDVNSRFLRR